MFVDNKDTALSFALNEDGIPIANKNTEAGTVALTLVMLCVSLTQVPMHSFCFYCCQSCVYRALGIKLANNRKVNADEKQVLASP